MAQKRHTCQCGGCKCFLCSSWTYKPNSVRRISPAGRPFLWAAHYCAALATYPKVWRTEPARARPKLSLQNQAPSLFGLAPCGVCPARGITDAAVRSYRTFSPLPLAGRYIFCGTFRQSALTLTSRTLSGTLLCGVRTFLPHHLTRQERPSGPAAYELIIVELPDRKSRDRCRPPRTTPARRGA